MKKILLILFLLPLTVFGQKQSIVHINTDNYPSETYWILMKDSLYGDTIASVPAGYYTQAATAYTDTIILADSITNICFLIRDTYGDGITYPGSYFYSICGDTIVNYPTPSFNTGLYSNRVVPSCMPTGPPTANCVPAVVIINLDQFGSETSWDIKDSIGALLASGGPYATAPNYQPQIEPVCLPMGELMFTIYDTYGDGLAGSLWGGNDGSYYLMQCGDTLVYGNIANFGTDSTHVFISDTCVPPPLVPGCMDENYIEYNPLATVNDSSCSVLRVYGCIDSTMYNYDTTANAMDYIDSCIYTLTLYDLAGNGWVGSKLEIYQEDTAAYILLSGYSQSYSLSLLSPKQVKAKFFINSQAAMTAIECGFSLVNSIGDTVIYVAGGFVNPIQPFFTYSGVTDCGNECISVVTGCLDSTAFNYDSLANTATTCYYQPGCMSPAYLEYYTQGFTADVNNGSCNVLALFGCMDSTSFNYDPTANVDNGGCIPIVTGCMNPLAFNYNALANTTDTCIPVVYGCTNSLAFNYDSLANTDDGSCEAITYGCTDSTMWNYSPSANLDDSSCVPYIYGCTDPTMFNYDQSANTDNGSCIPFIYGCTNSMTFNYDPLANTDNGTCVPFIYGCTNPIALNYCDSCNTDDFSCILPIYGCTDSTMFNYNPLANVDNSSCIPFIYGCTDPSMLNYNPQANSEDFSCIPYIYGCTDSTALNYDSLANTENGSCITIVEGCMDPTAFNYSGMANVNDSASCLYNAGCITGPGNPYWLNDPCYAWVISVDDYCCNNAWDEVCQSTYDYCNNSWAGPILSRTLEENIVVYPNPVNDKININKFVDIKVYNIIGDMIISKTNTNVLDVSKLNSGVYNLQIICNNKIVNKTIVKTINK